ncbi:hypothetical protein DTO166G4_1538 [Paecilomyces variotii]|nr:hypothetical protein DTO166G4_1538 [Paecilomyces variotii]KAJ9232359.1 hypothetical protein DTO166G5_6336 [Paecilomyces variotii]KAJ9317573.1 hypothetical protein DTO271D3_2039 [Paecilomyces variotii]KAJ9388069.1 hypothetical protein DTO063F5_2854 [Paecilomyces variotii]KAJ9405083.1 hypothetical protein DTO045G8_7256 [Paecilomyces variotii]
MSAAGRERSRSRSPRRSVSPRSPTSPRAGTRSPSPGVGRHNGHRGRNYSRSPSRERGRSRSYSRNRAGGRYRDRAYSRSRSPESPRRSSKIIVEKLTKNVTEEHLYEIFGTFGEIQSLELPMNKAFMTNRGTAYILYYEVADAEAAISHMHEAQLDGAILNVSIVLPRRAFSRSPPPARRGGFPRSGFGRPPPLDGGRAGGFRSPPPRRRSPPGRRYAGSRAMDRHDRYRPRSLSRSRSRSPRRGRSYTPSSPSRSPSPGRDSLRRDSPRRRRRRSPSYSSYSSYSGRSRSASRNRSRSRYGAGRR